MEALVEKHNLRLVIAESVSELYRVLMFMDAHTKHIHFNIFESFAFLWNEAMLTQNW